jgi:hypothetical protein
MRIYVRLCIGVRNDLRCLAVSHRFYPLCDKDVRPLRKSHAIPHGSIYSLSDRRAIRTTSVKQAVRALRMASIWASFLSSSGHAFADDSPTQKLQTTTSDTSSDAQPDTAAVTTSAQASPEQAAATAYQKALASYAKGDVPAALDSMRESYRLSKRPELLYNLAQLEDELKICRDSLADYRQYLELVPHGRYRDSAEQARQRLEQQCPPPAAAPPDTATIAANPAATTSEERHKESSVGPSETAYWSAPRVLGWSAIALGTLAGAGAVYCQSQAVQAKHELQQSLDDALAGGPPVDMSLQDRQDRYNHIAIGLGIAGGAMVASGALVLLLAPGKSGQQAQSASVYALPGLVGASYAQRF